MQETLNRLQGNLYLGNKFSHVNLIIQTKVGVTHNISKYTNIEYI